MNKKLEGLESVDQQETHGVSFSDHWSYNFHDDPKRLSFVLSRYKFSAQMIGVGKSVLELGCSEGIGATILGEHSKKYVGVDYDSVAIQTAIENQFPQNYSFHYKDFMNVVFGSFDAIVSLDVIEHILPEFEDEYFQTITKNLNSSGIAIVGTPNVTSEAYASMASKKGHVNLYSQERLVQSLKRHFHVVLPFGMNDEIAHTGFASMCHYLFCVACLKKTERTPNV